MVLLLSGFEQVKASHDASNPPNSVDDYKGFICDSKQHFEKPQYFIIINIDYWEGIDLQMKKKSIFSLLKFTYTVFYCV